MRRLWLLLFLLLSPCLAQPSLPPFQKVAEGLEFREVRLEQPRPLTMLQLRCDPARIKFHLLLAGDLKGESQTATARQMAQRLGLEAVVNCCYFGQQNEILGYAERVGHVLNPEVASGGVFSAFFYYDGARAGFKRRGEPLPKNVPVLFQAGPRLVWDGRAVEGLNNSAFANRSVLSQDRRGRITVVVVGAGSTTTLAELPGLLLRPVSRGGVEAERALNLDGGSSTQFYLDTATTKRALPGFARVPAFLGIEAP